MSSLAAHVWTYLFVSTYGIRMPKWMGELADALCQDHDDLAAMLGEFSNLCPSAMSAGNFTDTLKGELTELHAELRVRATDGSLPPLDLYADRPSLVLDSRTRRVPDTKGTHREIAADVCVNPVIVGEIWNAMVVYVDVGVPTSLSVSCLAALCSISGVKMFVVCNDDAGAASLRAAVANHAVLCDVNVPVYGTAGMDAKTFTTLFPKVCATFVCLTTPERVEADAFPDACTRFTYRNMLVVPDAGELPAPSIASGYGRMLDASAAHDCVRPESDSKTAVKYALSTRDLKNGLHLHVRFDGSEVGKSMLAFHDAMTRGDPAVRALLASEPAGEHAGRFAVVAVESRASASLAANLLRTAWATGASEAVVLLCSRDPTAHAFYRDNLNVGRLRTKVVELPPRDPFMRASPFSMNAYNAMMTHADFWNALREALPSGATHAWCVQDDGCVVRRVPQNIVANWLEFDYVGAPWHPGNLAHLRQLVPGLVGNGGVSLRDVSAMAAAADAGSRGSLRRTLFDDRYDMPEDVFFAHTLSELGSRVAPADVARVFAMEQVREDGAYAVHKPWLYHPLAVVQGIMDTANLELGIVSPQSTWTSSD